MDEKSLMKPKYLFGSIEIKIRNNETCSSQSGTACEKTGVVVFFSLILCMESLWLGNCSSRWILVFFYSIPLMVVFLRVIPFDFDDIKLNKCKKCLG